MTEDSHARGAFRIPTISNDDLSAFHEAHFGHVSIASFGTSFLNPVDRGHEDFTEHEIWEEEDDLGYYEDGAKRTLTDEQIEIFRHSELEALRKEQEKRSRSTLSDELDDGKQSTTEADITQASNSHAPCNSRNSQKKKKKKSAQRVKPEPKPDLRKRTWDVVDKGLDTLEYD